MGNVGKFENLGKCWGIWKSWEMLGEFENLGKNLLGGNLTHNSLLFWPAFAMGICHAKRRAINPGSVLDRVISQATSDDCVLYRLADYKKGKMAASRFFLTRLTNGVKESIFFSREGQTLGSWVTEFFIPSYSELLLELLLGEKYHVKLYYVTTVKCFYPKNDFSPFGG